MDERTKRIGLNEALFREVNERMYEVSEGFALEEGQFEILCECGDDNCTRQVGITPAVYEHVRSDAALFVIVPGHQLDPVEDVVEEHGAYDVVRKRPGPPERLAEATDPR